VYWGEQNGAVRVAAGDGITTLAPPDGLVPASIALFNGVPDEALTTQCGPQSCELRDGAPYHVVSGPAGLGALGISVSPAGALVLWGGGAPIFWGDAAGIHAGTHGGIQRQIVRGMPVKKP
jgi:hypothetical protein